MFSRTQRLVVDLRTPWLRPWESLIFWKMRRDDHLYELSNEEFEQLVVQICVRWLGPGVTLFAPGKDGGRDGKFSRKASCAEFKKRRGRRSSGLRVKRGLPPALLTDSP
jgi:hypothetical protein